MHSRITNGQSKEIYRCVPFIHSRLIFIRLFARFFLYSDSQTYISCYFVINLIGVDAEKALANALSQNYSLIKLSYTFREKYVGNQIINFG